MFLLMPTLSSVSVRRSKALFKVSSFWMRPPGTNQKSRAGGLLRRPSKIFHSAFSRMKSIEINGVFWTTFLNVELSSHMVFYVVDAGWLYHALALCLFSKYQL